MKQRFVAVLVLAFAILWALPTATHAGDGDSGFGFIETTSGGVTVLGVRAYMSTARNFTFTQTSPAKEKTIYAPALLPPNGSCLEAVVSHFQSGVMTGTNTSNEFRVFNHCSGTWIYSISLNDATFVSNYARTWAWTGPNWPTDTSTYNDETIYVTVQRYSASPNCWAVYLFNYNTGLWNAVATGCGTSPLPPILGPEGWGLFETFGFHQAPFPACNNLGSYGVMQMRSLQVYLNGSYVAADYDEVDTTSGGTMQCISNGTYTMKDAPNSGFGWVVCKPTQNGNCD